MSEAKVRIAYDGKLLQAGAMDVNDLAPALIEFAKLVQRINVVVGNKQPVKIMLKADAIRKGSFDITLDLVTNLLEEAKLLVGMSESSGLDAIMQILGYGTTVGTVGTNSYKGILGLIQFVKNRKAVEQHKDDKNNILLVLQDNISMTLTENMFNVYKDIEVRQHIEKVMEPLNKSGISSFEIRNPQDITDKAPEVKITADEVEYFLAPSLENVKKQENSYTQNMILKIVAAVFDENQKWRFTDGDATFWARINDEEFWQKIESRELLFGKGDQLKVECSVVQLLDADGTLTITRTINKVIEVVPKPTQLSLF